MRKPVITLSLVLFLLLCAGPLLVNGQSPPSRSLTYVNPRPGAQHVSPTTSLAIREGAPLSSAATTLDLFVVTGSESGRHSGTTTLSDDSRTLLFYPDEPFAYGETVSVSIRPGLTTITGTAIAETSYQFTVIDQPLEQFSRPTPDRALQRIASTESNGPYPHYYTFPEFTNIMTTTVTTPAQNTGDGLIFVAAMGILFDSQPALIILDNAGDPIYIEPTPANRTVSDFKKQTVDGTEYLTYHLGMPNPGWSNGSAYVMDDQYNVVDSWTIGNGYGADLHELRLLDNGHAIMLSYTPIPYDLRPYGGPADGTLLDIVLQEQDSAKNVVFEWHGSNHIPVDDTYADLDSDEPVDFMHTNAIEVDDDGNWLISNRHMSEITKINRQTGDVIWRLGGKSNEFAFTNDGGFSFQHSIRRLDNGHITLFDNGNLHDPPHSRVIEYALDETAKTITRVWQYPDDTTEYSSFMGDGQRLGNGNTFIGWGGQPKLSEVQSDGSLALEMRLGALSYRAFRFPWSGMPTDDPRAALRYDSDPTAVNLYASWNGATDITSYEVYAGPTKDSMSLMKTVPRSGFETSIQLTGLAADTCFFQVRPVHAQATDMPYSNLTFRTDLSVCKDRLSMNYFPLMYR